jgi:voltage-gated potassium channel
VGRTIAGARQESTPPTAKSPDVPDDHPLLARFLKDLTLRRAIGGIVTIATLFTLVSAALIRVAEPKTYENYGEACWWAIQTVSTVGYGDNVPTSPEGRAIASLVMLFGIALVPAITSLVVAVFINQQMRRGPLK